MPKTCCNDLAASGPFVQLLICCSPCIGLHHTHTVTRARPASSLGIELRYSFSDGVRHPAGVNVGETAAIFEQGARHVGRDIAGELPCGRPWPCCIALLHEWLFTCVLSQCASCLKRGLFSLLQAVADLLRCRQGRCKPYCHAAEHGHGLQIHEPARLFRQVGCIRTGRCRVQWPPSCTSAHV